MSGSIPSENAWFDRPDLDTGDRGLRFECTCCGNCCSGPEGFVLFTPQEASAIAARLGITVETFIAEYTRDTPEGRSITEKQTAHGMDCVFLDREKVPGKAVCGIYEDRPEQCRTWPFWKSVVRSPQAWRTASRLCPGMNEGTLYSPEHIRISAAKVVR